MIDANKKNHRCCKAFGEVPLTRARYKSGESLADVTCVPRAEFHGADAAWGKSTPWDGGDVTLTTESVPNLRFISAFSFYRMRGVLTLNFTNHLKLQYIGGQALMVGFHPDEDHVGTVGEVEATKRAEYKLASTFILQGHLPEVNAINEAMPHCWPGMTFVVSGTFPKLEAIQRHALGGADVADGTRCHGWEVGLQRAADALKDTSSRTYIVDIRDAGKLHQLGYQSGGPKVAEPIASMAGWPTAPSISNSGAKLDVATRLTDPDIELDAYMASSIPRKRKADGKQIVSFRISSL